MWLAKKAQDLSIAAKVKALAPYFVLFVVLQIIYLRLSLTPLSSDFRLGGDFISFHYVINIFDSDAYRAGMIPLWNPYVHSGFPWATGLEYKVFYPVQILISLLIGYSYAVAQAEFMLTIFFGGVGMFRLLNRLGLGQAACYYGAITFFSSGIFIGNSQHFGQIIVYAFTPWILTEVYQLYKSGETKHAAYGAVLLACTVTGGYSGTYIVLAYILFGLVTCLAFLSERRLRFIANAALMGGLAAGLSAVHLLQCLEGFWYTSRAAGLSYETAVVRDSLSALHLFTFVLPSAATNPLFAGSVPSDMSMWNIHMGALLPCLLVVALLSGKQRGLLWGTFGLSIFLLLAAMGDATFVRPFMNDYLPMMDKLRLNSAIFRGFTIIGLCVVASFGVERLREMRRSHLWFLLLPVALLLLVWGSGVSAAQASVLYGDLPVAAMVVAAFVVAIALFKRGKIGSSAFGALLVLILLSEFTYAVQANSAGLWAFDPAFRRQVEQAEARRDRAFGNIMHGRRVAQYPNEQNILPLLLRQPSNYGPSSTMLASYEEFMSSGAGITSVVAERISFPDSISYYPRETDVLEFLNRRGSDASRNLACTAPSQTIPVQVVRFSGPAQVTATGAPSLNSLKFRYSSSSDRVALLNQAYFPGWSVVIEESEKNVPIIKVNHAMTGLLLPAGSGTVSMEYAPRSYHVGKWISLVFMLCTGCYLALVQLCRGREPSRDGG